MAWDTGAPSSTQNYLAKKLKHFIKPAKKPVLPGDYIVPEDPFVMEKADHDQVELKDFAHTLARMNLTTIDDGIVSPVCDDQKMPSWSAFNSVVTTEHMAEQSVGFLPVLPHPVTDYATVFTAMDNFLDVLNQLDQTSLIVTCDEGVYHIAREIKLIHPDKFKGLVLCMGSFHMMNIVLGCLGKYLKGSGAQTIWTESSVFGVNVAENAMTGHHYKRSLKGMLLLSEALERLRWAEFFQKHGIEKYSDELHALEKLTNSTSNRDRAESQQTFADFTENCANLLTDFKAYVADGRKQSENFSYWDNFIQMVSLVKELLRADREGSWPLHLHTVQKILPLFAVFDCTNYLRWCSLYLEDMRKLPDTAPESHTELLAGKFVVKRNPVSFSAVGADMCLEQTINRSQKSSSGIIGSTHKKLYVAEWELIHHEMLAVSNLSKELSGQRHTYELAFHHEFTASETQKTELNVQAIMSTITAHGNPFVLPCVQPLLHNIMTQEVMSDDTREDLLNVQDKASMLYSTFRDKRYVSKTDSISSTISRYKLKTFKDLDRCKKSKAAIKIDLSKSVATAQKSVDLARVRGYDLEKLLKFDLIPSSYLFEKDQLMTKPVKRTLVQELEKELSADDYVSPTNWEVCQSTFLVDVMANFRKVDIKRLNMFGELCANLVDYVLSIAVRSTRIDFVFDTYIENSVKDSERGRRSRSRAIEMGSLACATPLPVDMDSFWSSSNNKTKLQQLLREQLVDLPSGRCSAELVASGVDGESPQHCQSVHNGTVTHLSDLDIDIEESDERLVPHAMHAVKTGSVRIVLLSSDTDVFVLGLFFWKMLQSHGLAELWMRAGVGDTTRYIPLHTIGDKCPELCQVLPAAHALTGCDITSKVGTKHAAIKADPTAYLGRFGKHINEDELFDAVLQAEHYLVKVLKQGTPCTTMDGLRY